MSYVGLVIKFRHEAKRLRGIKGVGRDGDMDEYFNNEYAKIYDKCASMLEEEIRDNSV